MSSANLNRGDIVVINVGGTRHETHKHTLKKIPATRLSKLTPNLSNFDSRLNEYFFDRHPGVFAEILNYYRSGKLHYPTSVCGRLFEEELEYWGLDPKEVEPCCWMTYTQYRNTEETLAAIDTLDYDADDMNQAEISKVFGWEDDYYWDRLSQWQMLKPKVWFFLDNAGRSKLSKILSIVSITIICLSIASFCLKTVPQFQVYTLSGSLIRNESIPNSGYAIFADDVTPLQAFMVIDVICNLFFTLELTLRFIFCPKKIDFVKNFINIANFLATLAFYVDISLFQTFPNVGDAHKSVGFFSILRVLQLFKLAQHSQGLKVLAKAFQASASELLMLAVFAMIGVVTFAALVFFGERLQQVGSDSDFPSIPDALWFAIVTMCTVGYGDRVPKTLAGRLAASVCALAGVLMISLPVPFIVSNFVKFYTHAQAREKLPRRKGRVLEPEEVKKRSDTQNMSLIRRLRKTSRKLTTTRTQKDKNANDIEGSTPEVPTSARSVPAPSPLLRNTRATRSLPPQSMKKLKLVQFDAIRL